MPHIDDEGNLLGRWNVVDVVVAIGVLMFVGAGIAAVAGQDVDLYGDLNEEQLTVVVESVERPFLSDALADVDDCERGATVEHVQIVDRFTSENRTVDVERIRVRSRLTAVREAGGWSYGSQDVYVGSEIQLDYCTVRLEGTVVEIGERGTPRVIEREAANGTIDLGDLPCSDPCVCFEFQDLLRERFSSESCVGVSE